MNSLGRRLRSLATIVLAAVIAIPRARADTVALKSGETIIGQVMLERSDDEVLVVKDAVAGVMREFAWTAVLEADATRYAAAARTANGSNWYTTTVPGERVTYRLDGGAHEMLGLVEREEDGFVTVRDSTTATPRKIAIVDVVAREPVDLVPQDVWPAAEIFERKRLALDPGDFRSWMRLALCGERVGVYDLARGAFESAAAATKDESQKKLARMGAARVTETALQEVQALLKLTELRALLDAAHWARVREAIDSFLDRHPKSTVRVTRALDVLRADFTRMRRAHFASRVAGAIEVVARRLIENRVRPSDVAFNDIQSWIRKEAIEEAFTDVEKLFSVDDPAVTAQEEKAFFDDRPKTDASWRRASYDSGSFVMRPGGLRVPTRDDWWQTATAGARAQFWWAIFVERGGLFEVRPFAGRVVCSMCDGVGTLVKLGTHGERIEYVCPRCFGAKFDHVIEFR